MHNAALGSRRAFPAPRDMHTATGMRHPPCLATATKLRPLPRQPPQRRGAAAAGERKWCKPALGCGVAPCSERSCGVLRTKDGGAEEAQQLPRQIGRDTETQHAQRDRGGDDPAEIVAAILALAFRDEGVGVVGRSRAGAKGEPLDVRGGHGAPKDVDGGGLHGALLDACERDGPHERLDGRERLARQCGRGELAEASQQWLLLKQAADLSSGALGAAIRAARVRRPRQKICLER
mmetsp:Transcript_48208/g.133604  ORF Transcript_48208/g.133604 Transcript_48208/m.133604 type:complete len:235 (+) Transcript_48208:141-845(+)